MFKKIASIFILLTLLLVAFSGCESDAESLDNKEEQDVVKITEKLYLSYINDIYTNPEDYIGKKIEIEGMFAFEMWEGNTYNYVYRVGPGCCGNDGAMCGFEFTTSQELPNANSWIKVIGTLQQYEEDGQKYLLLEDSEFTVLDKRGKENIEI